MAYSDPQVITVNAVAHSMPRVSSGVNASTYRTSDESHELVASHTYAKRKRRVIRFNFRKIAADPLTSENLEFTGSCYLVFDIPNTGYTAAEVKLESDGFLTFLQASSGAAVAKLLGGES